MCKVQDKDLLVPLVLGVTGHRDIEKNDIPKLKEKIEEIFDYIIEKYPTTPLILLSPLADGADRIIADVVFERFNNKNIIISVPLPFDEEIYKGTFAKGLTEYKAADTEEKLKLEKKSKDEYDKLIKLIDAQDNKYIPATIPMIFDKKSYDDLSDNDKRLKRREQYTLVGEYIAIHSHILIALEDVTSSGGKGGTSEIVTKKLSGNYDYFGSKLDLSEPEQGIVYRINTPKSNNKQLIENKYEIVKLFPNNKEQNWGTNDKRIRFNFVDLQEHILSKPCITRKEAENLNSFRQQHMKVECLNKLIKEHKEEIKKSSIKDIKKYHGADDENIKLLKKDKDNILIKNILIRRAITTISRKYQTKVNKIEKYI